MFGAEETAKEHRASDIETRTSLLNPDIGYRLSNIEYRISFTLAITV